MSPFEIGLLVIVAVAFGYLIYRVEADRRMLLRNPGVVIPIDEIPEGPEPEPEPEPQALAFDPENPPTSKVYKGQGGVYCSCHGNPVRFGDEVLWWPQPDGSVLLICKESTR